MEREHIQSLIDGEIQLHYVIRGKWNEQILIETKSGHCVDVAELGRLALAHLDSARARRVGEAVIQWVERNGGAEYLPTHSIDASQSSFAAARLIDAVNEALRGEP